MKEGPDITHIASAIGDPARAQMLMALLHIPAMSAGELAREAGVTAQTASGHLRRLEAAKIIEAWPQGRHRYYKLSDGRTAQLIEDLVGLAARAGHVRTRPGPRDAAMRRARTCYDHMAGEIAVMLFDRLRRSDGFAVGEYGLTLSEEGLALFERTGIRTADFKIGKRAECRSCLDWSERRPHLGGAAGALLLVRLTELGWVSRDRRALAVTAKGEKGFAELFA